MINKLLPRSPLGIALTAVTVILAISPEARKMTRRAAVKGISAVLSTVDQLKAATSSAQHQLNGLAEEARGTQKALDSERLSFHADIDPSPMDIHEKNPSLQLAYNVMNDDYLKRNVNEAQQELH